MENLALKELAQKVYQHCGLDYRNNLGSLELKTARRLQEIGISLWEYSRLPDHSPGEWDVLVELLTINETYFFREEKQLGVYQNVLLPQLLAGGENQSIKVWSAACSSGEEPYSLAMSTMDYSREAAAKVDITGTDINKKVLKAAAEGIYHKRSLSFRRIPPPWLNGYFTEQADSFALNDEIRKMVSFQHMNLLEENNNSHEKYDIIFCRNVLIYFDYETIRKVAEGFHRSLKKGGYLFLGHAENISNMGLDFETVSTNGTFYYRKG